MCERCAPYIQILEQESIRNGLQALATSGTINVEKLRRDLGVFSGIIFDGVNNNSGDSGAHGDVHEPPHIGERIVKLMEELGNDGFDFVRDYELFLEEIRKQYPLPDNNK